MDRRNVVPASQQRGFLGGPGGVAFRGRRLTPVAALGVSGARMEAHRGVQVAETEGDVPRCGILRDALEEEGKGPADPRGTPGRFGRKNRKEERNAGHKAVVGSKS